MLTCSRCGQRYPVGSARCAFDGAELRAEVDPRIGATLAGSYVLGAVAGESTRSRVYRATRRFAETACAVKLLRASLMADGFVRERFRSEARHAARVSHPNIVEVLEHGQSDEADPFLAMEWLEGEPLSKLIATEPIPLPRLVPIGLQVARALATAHEFGVTHQDLRPDNVLVLAGDHVKVLDFGLAGCLRGARVTSVGEVFASPFYLAPEHGTPEDTGVSSDLYALGVILFEGATRRLPFDASSPTSFVLQRLSTPAPRLRDLAPTCPEALDRLVAELLATDPAERPIRACRVVLELERLAAELAIALPSDAEPAPAGGPPSGEPVRTWSRRIAVFDRMLRTSSTVADQATRSALDTMHALLGELTALQAQGREGARWLDDHRATTRRAKRRLGAAMSALSAETLATREAVVALGRKASRLGAAAQAHVPALTAAHREIIAWEGRCAFAEPYPELAHAYRGAADILDAWHRARTHERQARTEAAEQAQTIRDLDGQMDALRGSLDAVARAADAQETEPTRALAALGVRAAELEAELLRAAERLCAPLRAEPALGPLFRELEGLVD
jgi:serine/threonine-protein kinase